MKALDPHGPAYPDLGVGVSKYRRLAREGIKTMPREMVLQYAAAIEKSIRAKQRSELQRELPAHPCNCASGTIHPDGKSIHKAMQNKHRAALLAAPDQIRRRRKPEEWQKLYDEAMTTKRK